MPRGNGTGPMGTGPMTGRGAGYCNGYATPGFANPIGFGGGFGGRFGGGRGNRRMFYATGVPGWGRMGYPAYTGTNEAAFDEKSALNSQAELLENQLHQIKQRLNSLDEKSE